MQRHAALTELSSMHAAMPRPQGFAPMRQRAIGCPCQDPGPQRTVLACATIVVVLLFPVIPRAP